MFQRLYIFSLIFMLAPVTGHARDWGNPDETPYRSDEAADTRVGDVLYIEGEIHAQQPIELREGKFNGVHTVVLNSPGGDGPAGLEMAQIIRERGLTTVVPANGTCASACTFVFQGGVRRIAYESSLFMYHGPRTFALQYLDEELCQDKGRRHCEEKAIESAYISSDEKIRDAFAELEGLGLSPQLLDLYMSLPDAPEEQWMEDENFVRKPDLYFSADDSHPGLSKPFSQNREIIRFWLHAIDAYNVVTEWREETNN